MNEKVCRTCWTWYSSDQAICAQCRAPLTAVDGSDTPAPPAAVTQSPATSMAASSADRIGWIGDKLTIGAGGVIAVALAALLLGARYFSPISSTDGTFSLRAPAGWSQTSDLKLTGGITPLVALYGPTTDGLQEHFVVFLYPRGYLSLSSLQSAGPSLVEGPTSGQNGEPGRFSPTDVNGVPAIVAESHVQQARVEFLVVDHANRTYVAVYTGAASRFERLKATGFDRIVASWQWK